MLDTPIYDEVVTEFGDPYIDEEFQTSSKKFEESKAELSKFVQEVYLEGVAMEPKTVEIPVATSPYRKRKHKGH